VADLSPEAAHGVAVAVLERHGLLDRLDPPALSLIVNGLEIASDDEFFLVAAARWDQERHRARLHRIATLEAAIAAYEAQAGAGPRIRTREGEYGSHTHCGLARAHGRSLPEILDDLRRLLAVERELARREPEPLPRGAPVGAKNAGAQCILSILSEIAPPVRAWDACGIVADLLIEAQIEARPREKVRRALYDRL